MLQPTPFTRQTQLAADYRAADIHRARFDARRSTTTAPDDSGAPRTAIRPIARLLRLRPHPR